MIKKSFEMPTWEDCAWKRIPCGKDNCPICGKIKRNRWRHIIKGDDLDDMKAVFDDVADIFKEMMELIRTDCARCGIDLENIDESNESGPPEPEKFVLWRKINKWRDKIRKLAEDEGLAFWVATEEAQDLFWYSNILAVKTYRQLCNEWELKHGDEFAEIHYEYTKRVILESLKIIKKSLLSASGLREDLRFEFEKVGEALEVLEKELLAI